MDNIFKSFLFESEGIYLNLIIKKQFHSNCLRFIIDGEITSNNEDLVINTSTKGSSRSFSLRYLNNPIFWISSNDWKGLRWEKYSYETKYSIFRDIKEMKDAYIKQREFIEIISSYFYDSIKRYKNIKLLYETSFQEILHDEE